jgi:hypothetical protein
VSVEDDERSGRPSTNKTTEILRKIRERIHEDRHRTIHELADTDGISYGVCQKILTGNLNMGRIASSSRQRARPHALKTTESVTNNNMVIVPHSPYLSDLAPSDFALFPKLKMKLNGRRFETVSDIQRESQGVLDSI